MKKYLKTAWRLFYRSLTLVVILPIIFILGTLVGLFVGGFLSVKEFLGRIDIKTYLTHSKAKHDANRHS